MKTLALCLFLSLSLSLSLFSAKTFPGDGRSDVTLIEWHPSQASFKI